MLISNAALGIPRLVTREVDFVGALTPVDIRPLEKQSGIALSQSPGSRWLALQMRVDRAPYDNPKLDRRWLTPSTASAWSISS